LALDVGVLKIVGHGLGEVVMLDDTDVADSVAVGVKLYELGMLLADAERPF
jgi:hypothetical protein